MKEVVIVSGARTAIGAFGGALKNVTAVTLGAAVMRSTLQRANVRPVINKEIKTCMPEKLKEKMATEIEKHVDEWDKEAKPVVVDEVVMGNVLQAGQGQNPARQAMIHAGIPKETSAMTVNKICGSGLKAIAVGATSIMAGQADVVLAGGQENMSLVPLALPKARWGHRMELSCTGDIYDLMVFDGLYEIFYGYHMGFTAENIASMYGISRHDQDVLSVQSHQRARKAIINGRFKDEIVPITIKNRKGETVFETDERPMDTTIEKISALKPAFKKDGSVTAGNASGINDAAAAVLMMSAERARELGIDPIVKIKSFSAGGLDPAYMGLGPVTAVNKILKYTGMEIGDIDMIELNEAFAAQAIGCCLELGIEPNRPNELGSGISLGHPIGCTGARQMVTGMNQMVRKNYKTGLITMCIGGGMGMAMIVER